MFSDNAQPMPTSNKLLIVEDDNTFRSRLAIAMTRFGYVVEQADTVSVAIGMVDRFPPDFAIIDLRLGDGSGLEVVDCIRAVRPDARVIVLTGYGNIPIAVAAVRAGAVDVIAKPVTADELHAALMTASTGSKVMPLDLMKPKDAQTQHIDTIYENCGRNVSETARQLNMHRRTLQRIMSRSKTGLDKQPSISAPER